MRLNGLAFNNNDINTSRDIKLEVTMSEFQILFQILLLFSFVYKY